MLRASLVVVVLCSAAPVRAQPVEEGVALEPWLETNGCVGSLECQEYGLCQRLGVQCVALSHGDCEQSLACRTSGLCRASGGGCVSDSNDRKRYSKGLMGAGIANMAVGALSVVGCLPLAWLGPACYGPVPPTGIVGSLTSFSVLLNAGIVMTAIGAVRVDRPRDAAAPTFRFDASGITVDF